MYISSITTKKHNIMKTLKLSHKSLLLAILIPFIFISCTEQGVPPVPKDKLISTKTAKEYIKLYDSVKYEAISKATGKPDALEFYYTIAELEGYLAYVKKEAKEQGVTANGIAISLGAYPKGSPKGEKYDNLTTIILRPYGKMNGVSYLVPPKETEIIESIDPMNNSDSSPPFD